MPRRKLNVVLHPAQARVWGSGARFKFVDAGRRWGKSYFAWLYLLSRAVANPGGIYWWVAPIYKELIPVSQIIRGTTGLGIFEKVLTSGTVIRYVRLRCGTEIYFHSADREDSLRGSPLDGLVIDEGGSLKGNRYEEELRPALVDRMGWLLVIGTPKGRNWFYRYYLKGQDRQANPDYESWMFPSLDNARSRGGYIEDAELEALKRDLPDLTYRQEVLAEYLEGEGVVFRHVDERVNPALRFLSRGVEDRLYSVGVDLAKTQDFTVLSAVDMETGQLVAWERFNSLDWEIQKPRIKAFSDRFPGPVWVDSTGLGDPVFDALASMGVPVKGYKISNASKTALIAKLSIFLDQGRVSFPPASEFPEGKHILADELKAYAYEITASGAITYGAPDGLHDDAVISLGLAAWGLPMTAREPNVSMEATTR